jgi:hypothetical protein
MGKFFPKPIWSPWPTGHRHLRQKVNKDVPSHSISLKLATVSGAEKIHTFQEPTHTKNGMQKKKKKIRDAKRPPG